MSLQVFTGLPASGKTSAIIDAMNDRKAQGGQVVLVLSNEHEELTRRPNVRAGGLMGCRDANKQYPIDHVVETKEATRLLATAAPGTLMVFDEAQYFSPRIVVDWATASARGVDVMVGTPSTAQLNALSDYEFSNVHMTVPCECGRESTHVIYTEDMVYPTHLCDLCYEDNMNTEVANLLETVKASEPFPGELHTYQPFYDVDMTGWGLVRTDCPARLNIALDAVARCAAVQEKLDHPVKQPSFIDLGCCSGFFSHGMSTHGFRSSGVDVSQDFIAWASQVARIKGQSVNYAKQDVLAFLQEDDKTYDVISTFATIQWVMAQRGYEAGLKCFELIFDKAESICVIEMGYTNEHIYKDKILDRPAEIDKDWVMNLMEASGKFHSIEFHPAGEAGIWRDIFVGFKQEPSSPRTFEDFPVSGATQVSNVQNYWEDGWVGKNLEVALRPGDRTSTLLLEGWRPEDSRPSTLTIRISGEVILSQEIGGGLFRIEAGIDIARDAALYLEIGSSQWFSPDNDARQLCFILRQLALS